MTMRVLLLLAFVCSAFAYTTDIYSGSELTVAISLNVIHNFDISNEISGEIGVGADLIVTDRCGNRAPAVPLGQVTLSASDVIPGESLVGCVWHGGNFVYDVATQLPGCLGTVQAVESFVDDLCIGDRCRDTCPLQLSSDLSRISGDIGDCRSIIQQAAKALVDCSSSLSKDSDKHYSVMAATSSPSGGGVYHNDLTPVGRRLKSHMAWAYGMGAVAGVALITTVALFIKNRKMRREITALQQNSVVYQEMS